MRAFLAPASARRNARVGATYSVPVSDLSADQLANEKRNLTLQARVSFGAPPPPFEAWSEADGHLHVPRFYGLSRFGPAEHDDRSDGAPAPALRFEGTLTPVQRRAASALLDTHLRTGDGGALATLPCGYGKTVLGVYLAAQRGRKVCVLVHKGVLRDQWRASFERFCPGVRVGVIQGKQWEVDDCDVVLAMVMTVARRQLDFAALDAFGMVIVDEAHHMGAPVMSQALRAFRARWIVGLTATLERADGLTTLVHWALGPEGFHADRVDEPVRVSIALYPGATRERVAARTGKPLMAAMINEMAAHPGRNAFLADRIAAMRAAGRVVMVLSDRIAQLDTLKRLVVARGVPEDDVGIFKGATKEAERAVQLARPVVMCSYGMANEGVDKKEADTCVMATPKGRVTQCIGRVQRPCETKQFPLVLDVVDDVSVFVGLRWKRQRGYAKEKYQVQVLSHDAEDAQWFA